MTRTSQRQGEQSEAGEGWRHQPAAIGFSLLCMTIYASHDVMRWHGAELPVSRAYVHLFKTI